VNSSAVGETICVKDGTYTENVDVTKSHLTIRSENGSASTIVQAADPDDHVLNVTSNYVNISGFTVCNATGSAGIYLGSGVEHCNISGNYASNNYHGIFLNNSSNNSLTNNYALNNTFGGISLRMSSCSNILRNNTANENSNMGIILLLFSNYNTLTNNTASNNTDCDFYSNENSHNNTVEDLTIASYPTTISFTYDNGIELKGVDTAPTDPTGKVNISKYVDATDVTVNSWLFLNVSYSDADIAGVQESTLKMWKHNGSWYGVEGSGVNEAENYVYANITEFSIFAPLGSAPSAGLNCTCGDICVNTTGWWRDGGLFNASSTPLQHAIDNATAGDIICVKDGNYTENVKVTIAHLTIQSENGSANCIVNASNSNDHVFRVTANYVNISGFTVENATGGGLAGIHLDVVEQCNISDNNATNNNALKNTWDGIHLSSSSDNNTLLNNTASKNDRGIILELSSKNHLIDNNASSNSQHGIFFDVHSCDNLLENNTAYNNTWVGIIIRQTSNKNILAKNIATENGKGIQILESASNNTVIDNEVYANNGAGIEITGSAHNNSIISNIIHDNTGGGGRGVIVTGSSHNNSITDNLLVNNSVAGIQLESGSNNSIVINNMVIDSGTEGIAVSTQNNVITDNRVWNSSNAGIYLSYSSKNMVANNTVKSEHGWPAIFLRASSYNYLTNNTASENKGDGIKLETNSNHNHIIGNNASNNIIGIYLTSSSNNTIYNNYFNNTNNAYDDGTNTWNITATLGTNIIGGPWFGGNYWSDYEGSDTNGNGLGDTKTPYNSSSSIQNGGDYLPLTEVNLRPVSDPNGPYTGTEGIVITFNGSGSYDPNGTIVSYEWDFGDGNTSTGVSPTYTYAQNGTYTVTLNVTDDNGASATNTTTATIDDAGPAANFTGTPTSGPEPLMVNFTDNSTSYDGITTWEWDFDNDSVIDSTEQNPSHTYSGGTYTVSLTVTEADGDRDTEGKVDYITVKSVKPLNCTCGDICVNTTGWWRDGDIFNSSLEPLLAAVNSSAVGETICVKDGTYTENVDVTKSHLTIRSENGSASTIVQAANPGDHVFEVKENNVTIAGFTVTGATNNWIVGIYLNNVEHCNISNNIADSNNWAGIRLRASSNNTIANNTASSSTVEGILLRESANNRIENNTAINNSHNGIVLRESSSNNLIIGNNASLNSNSGIRIESNSQNNTITSNTASSNYNGISLYDHSCNNLLEGV